MSLSFYPSFWPKIQQGIKVQSARKGDKRAKYSEVKFIKCHTTDNQNSMYFLLEKDPFLLTFKEIKEILDIDETFAIDEGFDTNDEFLDCLLKIYDTIDSDVFTIIRWIPIDMFTLYGKGFKVRVHYIMT